MALTPSTSRSSSYLDSFETPGYSSGAQGGSGSAKPSGSQVSRSGYNTQAFNNMVSRASSGSRTPIPTRSSTKVVRKGDAPELGEMPTFKAPEMDKRALKAATQNWQRRESGPCVKPSNRPWDATTKIPMSAR